MKKAILLIFLSLVWFACSKDEGGTSHLEVRLTDSPGDYEEVNIDIQRVEVHSNEGDQQAGWASLDVQAGVYDILKFTNGLDTLLGEADLPSGRISQIRLILGDNNTVKIDGQLKSLDAPSSAQSGLKLNIHAELVAGVTYRLTLDFDAAQSIVVTGNNAYKLKPVIRVFTEADGGSIEGGVTPVAANPAIYALSGTDTVATTYPDSLGHFLIRSAPAGIYVVSFVPATGYLPTLRADVVVIQGNVTALGTVTILQ